jgi:hypothetical protein
MPIAGTSTDVKVNPAENIPRFEDFTDVVFLHLFGHQWLEPKDNLAAGWLVSVSGLNSDGSTNFLGEFAAANNYNQWKVTTSTGRPVPTEFSGDKTLVKAPFNSPVGMKWLLELPETEETYLRLWSLYQQLGGGTEWGTSGQSSAYDDSDWTEAAEEI